MNKRQKRKLLFFIMIITISIVGYSFYNKYTLDFALKKPDNSLDKIEKSEPIKVTSTIPKTEQTKMENESNNQEKSPSVKEELASKQTLSSKEIAEKFIKAYLTYDVATPERYLEASKSYMTDNMYEHEKQHIRKPVLDKVKTSHISSELYPVSSEDKNIDSWNAIVLLEESKSNGDSEIITSCAYIDLLQQDDSSWLVDDILMDGVCP